MTDKDILNELLEKYPEGIKPCYPFPSRFPDIIDPVKVKAVYLGCDPSNKHTDTLEYVFALRSTPQKLKGFVTRHTNQLKAIGLEWNDVYAQNLCRNYFNNETSSGISIWKKTAREYWVDKLVEELTNQNIPGEIPILLTSAHLYEVLVTKLPWKNISAPEYYMGEVDIPIPPEANLLSRPLVPLYRGRTSGKDEKYEGLNYYLKNNIRLDSYIKRVKQILSFQ